MEIDFEPHDDQGPDEDPDLMPDDGGGAEANPDPVSIPEEQPGSGSDFMFGFHHVPRGGALRAELAPVSAKAGELESMHYLLDPKDYFTRSRRQALEAEVSQAAEKLQRYRRILSREVRRCHKNRDRIQADAAKLHLEDPMACYRQAETAQQKQYRDAVADRDAVSWVLSRAHAALRTARLGGFWSGGGFPAGPASVAPPPCPPVGPGQPGSEVDRLLSLGPVQTSQGPE